MNRQTYPVLDDQFDGEKVNLCPNGECRRIFSLLSHQRLLLI